jgi:hypothetical protein
VVGDAGTRIRESDGINDAGRKTSGVFAFYKYILLDFSWRNERKCLFLQPKVDYNILLWI